MLEVSAQSFHLALDGQWALIVSTIAALILTLARWFWTGS